MPTIEEAKKRIAEIKKQRNELKYEQDELEKIISDDSQAKRLANIQACEGKYYLLKGDPPFESRCEGVTGFKILEIDPTSSLTYAHCIILLNGSYCSTYLTFGIIQDRLYLWAPASPMRIRLDNEPNLIDYYREVTREEFLEAAAAHSLIDEI